MTPTTMRDLFLLDPNVTFLNHGSFGACPRPVFEVYQRWQRELEREPVDFLGRRGQELMAEARARLAPYVGSGPDDLVYVPNATHGVNIVAHSLPLAPGDEVLGTDHEYGACDRVWGILCERAGATYRLARIGAPVTTHAALVESVWSAVTERTRVLFFSHITSATGLIFPVADLCARARAAGILTVIDGAHGPGQVPVDLAALGADFYAGNCHKWLCAPKGAAFLWARPEVQHLVAPLVISWGARPEHPAPNRFVDDLEFTGTRDIAPYLTVPAAIDFQREHDWDAVQRACHALLREARTRLLAVPGTSPLSPDDPAWYAQMAAIQLPPYADLVALSERLFAEHHVEVPVYEWDGRPIIRVAIQAYNRPEDVDALMVALATVLSRPGA